MVDTVADEVHVSEYNSKILEKIYKDVNNYVFPAII